MLTSFKLSFILLRMFSSTQRISLLRKTYSTSIKQMILNTRNNVCLTLGWSQTLVGKAYSSLYPNDLHFTKSCRLQEAIVDNVEAGMAMINFHSCLYLDKKDRNEITHCSFSPPLTWKDSKKNSKLCIFFNRQGNN